MALHPDLRIPAGILLKRYSGWIIASVSLLAIGVLISCVIRFWPRKLTAVVNPRLPLVVLRGGQIGILLPTDVLIAEVEAYPSTAASFLHFDWIRGQESVHPDRLLLCAGTVKSDGVPQNLSPTGEQYPQRPSLSQHFDRG